MENIDFRRIVERLPLVVYTDELDERSSARYVSPQIAQLLGYTAEEWVADPGLFAERLHPDDRERVLADVARRNRGRPDGHVDYRLVHRDGRVVWVRDEEEVVAAADGRPDHVAGYLQDVTQRREDRDRLELLARILELGAEEPTPDRLIRDAADLLAAAIGNVTVTYAEIDPDGGIHPRVSTSSQGLWDGLRVIPESLAALERGPVVVDDVLLEPWLEQAWPLLAKRGVRAAVDMPLRRDGRVAAVLWFNAAEPRHWTDAEVRTLTEVTAQLGLTLERARAREEQQRAIDDLHRRDAMLEAVTFAAELLLAEPLWTDAVPNLLARLGSALGASRSYIFENRIDEAGDVRTSQRYEWVAAGITAELDNPLLQDLRFADVGLERYVEVALRNEIYGGRVRDLPPEERPTYEDQGVLSVLSVPIFVDGEWWGFVGFDDCVDEREWTAAETDTLRIAASLVAAAIRRARSEAVLREHEQKLRAVFESALDAIFITSDEREYVDANPAACELLGVARRNLIGRRIDDFLPPARRATVAVDWARFRARDEVNEEWESLRADGEIRQVEASARPGFLPGLNIAFLRDVTDRKRLENDLLNAQKLESIGRLAGGIAHDFNNLLTAIGGYAALLLERAGDDEQARDLAQIARAADRAGELTRQLLAFGRRQVLRPCVLDLNETLDGVGSLLRRLLGEDVELELRPAPRPATVLADPGQVEQVIVNLAVNARDAMPRGGRLTFTVREVAEHGVTYVELVASDTGTGMDDATLEKVFEPFFTTREQGVGLGLASVHGIVSQSGGDVSAASELGLGSTFVVRLPRVAGAPADPAPPEQAGAETGEETILLVEDEDVVRALAQRVLERSGYSVIACANGSEAIAASDRHEPPIQLLLTDVVMPGLRGHEVADRISASRPGIKVLYMSGYADEAVLGGAALGGRGLLEKPFAVDELARRVREALES